MNRTSQVCWMLATILCSHELVWASPPDLAARRHQKGPLVQVHEIQPHRQRATWSFVVTHGMGGTTHDDRFYRLATEIKRRQQHSNVYLVDWSEASKAKCFGVPVPWLVAARIDAVGDAAARELAARKIDPIRCTLIGESFGNCVNSRIASRWDGVAGMLLFNPPHELGGYILAPRTVAARAWAFHTDSALDSQATIGHRGVYLECPNEWTTLKRHTYGVCWLQQLLAHGRTQWLMQTPELPEVGETYYSASAETDGDLALTPRLRERVRPDCQTAATK